MKRIILAALVASLTTAAPALATFPGQDGLIAYVRGGDIWVQSPDGGPARQLTAGPQVDAEPEWSPDGSELMFSRDGMIMRMSADGSGIAPVVAGQSPQFSSDGRRIAYGDGGRVFVAGRDGSSPAPITGDDWYRTAEDWSPRDGMILWEVGDDTDSIGGTSPAGSELRWAAPRKDDEATPDREDAVDWESPSWSPDGSRLAFTYELASFNPCADAGCPPDPDLGINVMDLSGERTVVYRSRSRAFDPVFSPDGRRIAFSEDGTVNVMDADGSNVRLVGPGETPDWQPLAFKARIPEEPKVLTVAVPVAVPGPERIVTQTVQEPAAKCVIPATKRRLTLKIRAPRAFKKGAIIRVRLVGSKARVIGR
ncbi:MAG TPA: hypothetical protein VJP59_00195 [Gemmatimonadota bacterium]|nr:hypothetical protein [Gemmatimonadota bacterium]